LLSQIVNNQQDNSRVTLSSHLELLPALKQLKDLMAISPIQKVQKLFEEPKFIIF